MSDLLFTPVFWWPALAAVATALVLGIGWSFFFGLRSGKHILLLWPLRAAAVAAFVVVLVQPQKKQDEVTVLKPQVAVLVDASESMTDPVDEEQPRRFERVKTFLDSPALAGARDKFDVRVLTFDQGITERSGDAGEIQWKGSRSGVLTAIAQTQDRFRGQPLAAILLLSDGLDTTGAAKAESVASSTPVFTFEMERPFKPKAVAKRVSVANVDYPQRVVAGWDVDIRVSLAAMGMSGRTVSVELWREGRKQRDATVAFTAEEQTRDTAFAASHDKPGIVQYELRVPDPAADKEARSYPFLIEVVEPGNRILYLQNTLGFDFKFLRKAIAGDRNLQLSSYVRWADNKLVAIGEAGTRTRQAALDFTQRSLALFAVVMLGDLAPDALTALQCKAIRDFVDRGGGLVLLGGGNMFTSPDFKKSQLGDLLPVQIARGAEYREGRFPVEITQTGLRHPVFGPLFAQVKDFAPLLTCNVVDGVAPTAEVLIEALVDGKLRPLVVSMRFGQGRVVVVLTDTIWRWRLASKGWTSERSAYDTFWAQLMDWLIPKEKKDQNANRIELFTERSNFLLGERPEIRAIVNVQSQGARPPATLPLQVRTPEEKVFEYVLRPATLQASDGRQMPGFKVEVEPNVPGVYAAKTQANIGGATVTSETRFVVTKPVTELTGKAINRDLLARIAQSSGGKYYPLAEWDKWREDIRYTEQRVTRMQLLDLWNHPLVLALLMGVLAADWVARKLWSLP